MGQWIRSAALALVAAGAAQANAVAAAPVVTKPADHRSHGGSAPAGHARPMYGAGDRYVAPRPVHVAGPYHGRYVSGPRVGVVIGTPWPGYWSGPRYYGYPYGYPYPYPYPAYPPTTIVVPPAVPPVYVEQPVESAAPAAGYWYWCNEPRGWYPDVANCPAGWQAVPPRAAQ